MSIEENIVNGLLTPKIDVLIIEDFLSSTDYAREM